MTICSNTELIARAKQLFLANYARGTDIEKVLAVKIEGTVGRMLASAFGLKSRKEVKSLFAKLLVRKEIEQKKLMFEIGRITASLMKTYGRSTVETGDFISAIVLYFLTERKQDLKSLEEKLEILDRQIDLRSLVNKLVSNDFIEYSEGFYKIKLARLFGEK